MIVEIIPMIDHESYYINNKVMMKDGNDNWVCQHELSTQERNAFANYRKSVIENKRFTKHTKSVYKGS